MQRRDFMGLCASALMIPWAARGQQAKLPTIGYLGNASQESWTERLEAFRHGLSDAGFVEGRDVTIEYRWSDGKYDRLQEFAKELVRLRVSVIVTPGSTASAEAA